MGPSPDPHDCGQTVAIACSGSNAEVQLLSPQVLLATVGGSSKAVQTTVDLVLCLGNGIELLAQYCPRSNLPYC